MKTYNINRNKQGKRIISLFAIHFILIGLWINPVSAQNELLVFNNWVMYKNTGNSLYGHMAAQAIDRLEARTEKVNKVVTLSEWQQRQAWLRQNLDDLLGPLPAKTPLNAKVVKVINKPNFKLEHIVFESQPGVYVTSTLFIPANIKRKAKLPVIIYCSGHTAEGYRSKAYQHKILNLVQKGFMVFAFDPVSQGERLQYLDKESGKSKVGGPTSEHSFAGAQAFITGNSMAKFMTWDGIRAIDYLTTRPDIDPARIGITGRSGGGTQSALIAAYDDRIYAAAPECYITNFTRIFESIGPQDAEQNLPKSIARGIDHPDLLAVRAPKPALMVTTTNDFFSIQGARETASEVSRVYKAYNEKDKFSMVEDIDSHASTKKNREAMYAFFQKYLNNPGSSIDMEIEHLSEDELRVTGSGQALTSLGGESIFKVFSDEAASLVERIVKQRSEDANHLQKVMEKASLHSSKSSSSENIPVLTGKISRKDYTIEKYHIKGQGDYRMPFLLFVPDKASDKAMVYIHPDGKISDSEEGGQIEWFVKRGITVLAPDMIGTGETGPGDYKGDSFIKDISYNIWFASVLIDESLAEIRAKDLMILTTFLKNYGNAQEIFGLAKGNMSPVLLMAAATDKRIDKIAVLDAYVSYQSVVLNELYDPTYIHNAQPGVLQHYDLPDLMAALAPRSLLISARSNKQDNYFIKGNWQKDSEYIKSIFEKSNALDKLDIYTCEGDCEAKNWLSDWMGKISF
jgi:hypothetical protein